MSNTIIFVPGKNPKPEPEMHYDWLWRSLIRGVWRAAPDVAVDLRRQPGAFKLGAWNYLYYNRHASIEGDEKWIDHAIQTECASEDEINEALSWRKSTIRLMYEIGDRFHMLIPWIPDPRIRSMITDTVPYFENKNDIAGRVREIIKLLIVEATRNKEKILLIGHSMGSIIAYEAMWELTHEDRVDYNINLFLTLGSPLGMRYVQKHLLGFVGSTQPSFPNGIGWWKNVSAHGDLVSVDQKVSDDFKSMLDHSEVGQIEDYCEGVFNWYRNDDGLNVHRSYGYLVNPIVGKIVADWWLRNTEKKVVKKAPKIPKVIAHRGYPNRYPGNTLTGFKSVMQAGARMVELDVQLSADGIPVLYHDADTQRMSGRPGLLLDMSLSEIKELEVYYPERFGEKYRGTPVSTLGEFCELMTAWPQVEAFVEIKEESINYFGLVKVADTVVKTINQIRDRCIVISFSDRCVEYVRTRYDMRVGWVLPAWNSKTKARAALLAPEFLFVNTKRLPEDPHDLWRGPWKWAVYVVDDPEQALAYPPRGIDYVETDEFCDLIKDPQLRPHPSPLPQAEGS